MAKRKTKRNMFSGFTGGDAYDEFTRNYLYYFTSKIGTKKDHFLGAFFSTLGICIGILLYYLYLVNISKSLSYYGPLSSLSLLCLVFFYSSYILFMGVQINIINYKKAQKNR